ncbi:MULTISPECIES: hypothetical protein [Sphingobacterium]|uniref:hypothetical protein n=1 Tax=Sphingobacterium TaxID=28453 RepID=UPI0008A3B91D|nr:MULTISPECIES: hypothetical protein [Sphingobacterium]OFV11841.1 hypothetical protein HMPREF3127_18430 [Sphingobacterium sp. HMSC13C05]HAF32591.1 hypothetical protein [Sphingobacterium sp.]HAL54067.1 hypothetical protein [Sphingobacterium sp.]HBX63299.1 hypothetical protein [Flavobacteriaceae bacterium]
MSINLDFHFVAFLDILGYASMVKSDLEGPKGEEKFFEKLYEIHQKTTRLNKPELELEVIQFSDSVIFYSKYDIKNIQKFLKIIADYQFEMIKEGFLIRGGVTFGKHFHKDNFLFSSGLIDAYRLESELAKTPRIIVSEDLISLIGSTILKVEYLLIDGNYKIIDFLHKRDITEDLTKNLNRISDSLIKKATNESLIEKGIWLKEYFNHKGIKIDVEYKKFRNI